MKHAVRETLKRVALVVALCGSSACATTLQVTAPLTLPARVPVRTFPSVWVVGGSFAEDQQVVDALAQHLAGDQEIEVRQVDLAELEPARKAGKISSSTVVLMGELALREGVERYWDSAPVQTCGYYTCSTQYQSYVAAAPAVSGELVLTVYEGPTARVLQRERFQRSVVAGDPEAARADVLALLIEDAMRAVDILNERIRVELYEVDLPEAERANKLIKKGKWDEGRAELEKAKLRLSGMKKREQAKVWFNLGMARRFAPGKNGLDQAAFESAKRALEWALRLDPKPAHKQALARLELDQQRKLDLDAQAEARAHNFAAVNASEVVPPAEGASDVAEESGVAAPAKVEPKPSGDDAKGNDAASDDNRTEGAR